MAITDLASARTELLARGYARFANVSNDRVDSWLNEAKNRFEDYQFDWPWLKTSTSGTGPLTISDLRRVSSVVDVNTKQALDGMDASAIIEYENADLALTGPPCAWYLTSDTILTTYPVTTHTLSVRYIKFSPELSADADLPLIPARYRMTWVDLAEVEVLRFGVKDAASAGALEQGVFRRLGEIAGVYSMQAQTDYTETLITGASVDG